MTQKKQIRILGIRGLPANHGGFETFAEHLATYLVSKGWDVTVYCQEEGKGKPHSELWKGVKLLHVPFESTGSRGSVYFDWWTTRAATSHAEGVNLVLGYNTAIFSVLYRIKGKNNVINMDGIEWKRIKWSWPVRTWFYVNERFGCWFGHHLIADHPEIKNHLSTRVNRNKITTIPYGSDALSEADIDVLGHYGLEPYKYSVIIARPEPENLIKEIVSAYTRKKRNGPLVVLGEYKPSESPYHKEVMTAAGGEIKFVGAIFDKKIVGALRYYTRLYIHGHQVGGTNPSLVEALGAGSPVLAHDNLFNRWVAGSGARYFTDEETCVSSLNEILDSEALLERMRDASRQRHQQEFTWDKVLGAYEALLMQWQM